MANEIKAKFSSSAALNITLASLASSAVGVGRQSDIVDNTVNRFQEILIYVKLKQGTSPSGNKSAQIYLIRDDNAGHRSDGAGVSDAAITVLNAALIGVMQNKSSPATGEEMYGEFRIVNPGPKWGIAIVHDTAVNLDATGGNHHVKFIGVNPEIQ